jgi:hypothetical protein
LDTVGARRGSTEFGAPTVCHYPLYGVAVREQSVILAAFWRFDPHAAAATTIEEDADD